MGRGIGGEDRRARWSQRGRDQGGRREQEGGAQVVDT
jgi:hypothetical protein